VVAGRLEGRICSAGRGRSSPRRVRGRFCSGRQPQRRRMPPQRADATTPRPAPVRAPHLDCPPPRPSPQRPPCLSPATPAVPITRSAHHPPSPPCPPHPRTHRPPPRAPADKSVRLLVLRRVDGWWGMGEGCWVAGKSGGGWWAVGTAGGGQFGRWAPRLAPSAVHTARWTPSARRRHPSGTPPNAAGAHGRDQAAAAPVEPPT
jgi:hypothetical protein